MDCRASLAMTSEVTNVTLIVTNVTLVPRHKWPYIMNRFRNKFGMTGGAMDSIINVLHNNLPWVWVAVTIICVVIESLTLSLTTIWFGISAFLMVFLAFTPIPFSAQLFIFVAVALILLIFTRPVVKRRLNQKQIATNYERIIGQIAVVTKKITALDKGSVKINGMEWTAAVKEDITLEKGSKCIIDEIAGVTAYVKQI